MSVIRRAGISTHSESSTRHANGFRYADDAAESVIPMRITNNSSWHYLAGDTTAAAEVKTTVEMVMECFFMNGHDSRLLWHCVCHSSMIAMTTSGTNQQMTPDCHNWYHRVIRGHVNSWRVPLSECRRVSGCRGGRISGGFYMVVWSI